MLVFGPHGRGFNPRHTVEIFFFKITVASWYIMLVLLYELQGWGFKSKQRQNLFLLMKFDIFCFCGTVGNVSQRNTKSMFVFWVKMFSSLVETSRLWWWFQQRQSPLTTSSIHLIITQPFVNPSWRFQLVKLAKTLTFHQFVMQKIKILPLNSLIWPFLEWCITKCIALSQRHLFIWS